MWVALTELNLFPKRKQDKKLAEGLQRGSRKMQQGSVWIRSKCISYICYEVLKEERIIHVCTIKTWRYFKGYNITNVNTILLVISVAIIHYGHEYNPLRDLWPLFPVPSPFAGSRLHLGSCWLVDAHGPSVEKQAICQFQYYWLIDWILLLGVHVVMKEQPFVVLTALPWAGRATLPSTVSFCSAEVIHLWWISAVCRHHKG